MRKEITPTRTKSLRLTLDEWRAVQGAADAAHMTTHGWIRAVVTVALGSSELPDQIERLIANRVLNERRTG